jgi:hypothetical protein
MFIPDSGSGFSFYPESRVSEKTKIKRREKIICCLAVDGKASLSILENQPSRQGASSSSKLTHIFYDSKCKVNYNFSYLNKEMQINAKPKRALLNRSPKRAGSSVPDPKVFGLPGPVSQRYGSRFGFRSGSFSHQAKIFLKNFISTVSYFFMTNYL